MEMGRGRKVKRGCYASEREWDWNNPLDAVSGAVGKISVGVLDEDRKEGCQILELFRFG